MYLRSPNYVRDLIPDTKPVLMSDLTLPRWVRYSNPAIAGVGVLTCLIYWLISRDWF